MKFDLFTFTKAEPLHNQNLLTCLYQQAEKDLRHSLLQEQPALKDAIQSWHTDSELQEILRKGQLHLSINKH